MQLEQALRRLLEIFRCISTGQRRIGYPLMNFQSAQSEGSVGVSVL
jgi:hypothetical protein